MSMRANAWPTGSEPTIPISRAPPTSTAAIRTSVHSCWRTADVEMPTLTSPTTSCEFGRRIGTLARIDGPRVPDCRLTVSRPASASAGIGAHRLTEFVRVRVREPDAPGRS